MNAGSSTTGFLEYLGLYVKIFSIILFLLLVVRVTPGHQHDFETYYYAAKTWTQGLNPYETSDLRVVSGDPSILPYAYPPLTLGLTSLLNFTSPSVGKIIYTILSLTQISILCILWARILSNSIRLDTLFTPFTLFAFNAFPVAILSGNIALPEFFLAWMGVYFFMKERVRLAGFFILLSALFKLSPILLILPLALYNGGRDRKTILLVLLFFILYLSLNILLLPGLMPGYLESLRSVPVQSAETSYNEPGSFRSLNLLFGGLIPLNAVKLSYLAFAGFILFFSIKTVKNSFSVLGRLDYAFFTLLTYALILPRFKAYSFILLLPVLYYVFKRFVHPYSRVAYILLTLGFACMNLYIFNDAFFTDSQINALSHLRWLAVFASWIAYVGWMRRESS